MDELGRGLNGRMNCRIKLCGHTRNAPPQYCKAQLGHPGDCVKMDLKNEDWERTLAWGYCPRCMGNWITGTGCVCRRSLWMELLTAMSYGAVASYLIRWALRGGKK